MVHHCQSPPDTRRTQSLHLELRTSPTVSQNRSSLSQEAPPRHFSKINEKQTHQLYIGALETNKPTNPLQDVVSEGKAKFTKMDSSGETHRSVWLRIYSYLQTRIVSRSPDVHGRKGLWAGRPGCQHAQGYFWRSESICAQNRFKGSTRFVSAGSPSPLTGSSHPFCFLVNLNGLQIKCVCKGRVLAEWQAHHLECCIP